MLDVIPLMLTMFDPNNDLERSLVKASTDTSHRPQFYRDLLLSDIFVINEGGESLEIEDGVAKQGGAIQLQSWQRDGENWTPMFSSLPRLQQSLQTEENYLRLNTKSFFEITRGSNVVLNPNLEYGKEFTTLEIASILDGSIFHAGQGYTVEKATQVLLGQPALYPTKLVESLSRLFRRLPMVKAAYLAHIHDPARDEAPHTLIGIDAAGEWDRIVGDAGMVAGETMPANEIVDFVRVLPGDNGVSQYLVHETKPFYKRSLLRNLFG
jgi:hypothetical protein